MATSQNGWSVIPVGQDKNPFPDTNVIPIPGIRSGEVATVLHYVGQQFNNRVEKLVNGWCWGFANKLISASNVTSNHASGTAIDLNAPNHPQYKKGTFSNKQVDEIHKILAECDGVIAWGGDYSAARVDEMHFEINKGQAEVAALARKLSKSDSKENIEMVTMHGLEVIHRFRLGEPVSQYSIDHRLNKMTFDEADADVCKMAADRLSKQAEAVKEARELLNSHLPISLR